MEKLTKEQVETLKKKHGEVFEIEVEEGDVLLLCSDGLSNMMEDKTMEAIIKMNPEDMEQAARQLVDEANKAGGKDNISVVLVRI